VIVRFVDIDGIDDHHSFNLFSVLYTHSHDIPCGWVGGGGRIFTQRVTYGSN
jgi:hypothetical protein